MTIMYNVLKAVPIPNIVNIIKNKIFVFNLESNHLPKNIQPKIGTAIDIPS